MTFADALNSGSNLLQNINGIAQYNSAQSQAMAERQMEFQQLSNAEAMAFNHNEAALTRNWQEFLSNTAHQREVRDLRAAGLNPVLSALGGNGASVGSGATAQGVSSAGAKGSVDTSANAALVGLLGSILSNTQQLEAANINARTQEAVADKYTAMNQIVAEINAMANKYSADQHLKGTVYSADSARASSKYASDTSYNANVYRTDKEYDSARRSREMQQAIAHNQNDAKNNYYNWQVEAGRKTFGLDATNTVANIVSRLIRW